MTNQGVFAVVVETDERAFEIRTNSTHRDHAFGVVDEKGREYGARCAAWEVNYRIATDADMAKGYGFVTGYAPGHYFVFRPHAMRGGKTFGALQPEQIFASDGLREIAMAKYLRGARARAEKQSAGKASFAA